MEIRFDFSIDGWLATKVEGNSVEDCKEKLLKMSLEEILENGYVNDFEIKDIDREITEASYDIHVSSVDYEIEDYEVNEGQTVEEVKASLPQEFDFTLKYIRPETLEELIASEIELATNFCPYRFNFEIKKIF